MGDLGGLGWSSCSCSDQKNPLPDRQKSFLTTLFPHRTGGKGLKSFKYSWICSHFFPVLPSFCAASLPAEHLTGGAVERGAGGKLFRKEPQVKNKWSVNSPSASRLVPEGFSLLLSTCFRDLLPPLFAISYCQVLKLEARNTEAILPRAPERANH